MYSSIINQCVWKILSYFLCLCFIVLLFLLQYSQLRLRYWNTWTRKLLSVRPFVPFLWTRHLKSIHADSVMNWFDSGGLRSRSRWPHKTHSPAVTQQFKSLSRNKRQKCPTEENYAVMTICIQKVKGQISLWHNIHRKCSGHYSTPWLRNSSLTDAPRRTRWWFLLML